MQRTRRPLLTLTFAALLTACGYSGGSDTRANDDFRIVTLAEGLEHPWSMAFLPDGRILITERPGRLRLFANGKLHPEPIAGLPPVAAHGQGGLLDIALHPDFANNGLVYLSFAMRDADGVGTSVGRARLDGHRLVDGHKLFDLLPRSNARQHFGSRLVFDRQGNLYITLGDRGDRDRAQDLGDHAGSVIRISAEGLVPQDNPFVDRDGARPEIFSYGHRNLQGAALHPATGELWTHEHGPQGGDELNVVRSGRNYGWPVITYGKEYVTGFDIGTTQKDGMEQPLHYWVPSIAPSGMAFYTGDKFPGWRGNLFLGSLKFRLLVRLELDGEKVVREVRLLQDVLGRIRDVRTGPDGYLYLLTDASDGKLVRLEPTR